MRKIIGLIILFLCVTLFIWANFIETADDQVVMETITEEDEPVIAENEGLPDYEMIQEVQRSPEERIK